MRCEKIFLHTWAGGRTVQTNNCYKSDAFLNSITSWAIHLEPVKQH